jgi:hypothetical protein
VDNGNVKHRAKEMRCVVCSKRGEYWHHGIVTCRACNLFFRRAIVQKRVFACVRTRTDMPGSCDVARPGLI